MLQDLDLLSFHEWWACGVGTFGGAQGGDFGLITDTPSFGRQGSAGSSYLRWANLTKTQMRKNLLFSTQFCYSCKYSHECVAISELKNLKFRNCKFETCFTALKFRDQISICNTLPNWAGLSEKFWVPLLTHCNLAMALKSISEECTLFNHAAPPYPT